MIHVGATTCMFSCHIIEKGMFRLAFHFSIAHLLETPLDCRSAQLHYQESTHGAMFGMWPPPPHLQAKVVLLEREVEGMDFARRWALKNNRPS